MTRGPLPHLLGTSCAGAALLVVLALTDVEVSVWPWMLGAVFIGTVWWMLAGDGATSEAPAWQAPEPDPPPMRFTADLQTRRAVTTIADAQPSRGFTATALTAALAARARARLVRHHAAPADDPLAHADGLLSPQLLDYLRRDGTDHTQTVSPRTLRIYLKEIEAL